MQTVEMANSRAASMQLSVKNIHTQERVHRLTADVASLSARLAHVQEERARHASARVTDAHKAEDAASFYEAMTKTLTCVFSSEAAAPQPVPSTSGVAHAGA